MKLVPGGETQYQLVNKQKQDDFSCDRPIAGSSALLSCAYRQMLEMSCLWRMLLADFDVMLSV